MDALQDAARGGAHLFTAREVVVLLRAAASHASGSNGEWLQVEAASRSERVTRELSGPRFVDAMQLRAIQVGFRVWGSGCRVQGPGFRVRI